jgi:hypothetical protein
VNPIKRVGRYVSPARVFELETWDHPTFRLGSGRGKILCAAASDELLDHGEGRSRRARGVAHTGRAVRLPALCREQGLGGHPAGPRASQLGGGGGADCPSATNGSRRSASPNRSPARCRSTVLCHRSPYRDASRESGRVARRGPSIVNGLIDAALDAGATALKPVAKSFWGCGGVVQGPDGNGLEGRDLGKEGQRPRHPGDRRFGAASKASPDHPRIPTVRVRARARTQRPGCHWHRELQSRPESSFLERSPGVSVTEILVPHGPRPTLELQSVLRVGRRQNRSRSISAAIARSGATVARASSSSSSSSSRSSASAARARSRSHVRTASSAR